MSVLPELVQIENHHQWGGRMGELMAVIAAPEPGALLVNVLISRLGSQFVVPIS